jgi:hypothetical protein
MPDDDEVLEEKEPAEDEGELIRVRRAKLQKILDSGAEPYKSS